VAPNVLSVGASGSLFGLLGSLYSEVRAEIRLFEVFLHIKVTFLHIKSVFLHIKIGVFKVEMVFFGTFYI
jgi:membrane associated rhomboid family serine protease